MGKTLTNVQLERLLVAFLEKSPHMEEMLFKDHGISLMNLDGRITEKVHRHFCDRGIPVLSVHDSYIVDYTRVAELKAAMRDASLAEVGVDLATANNFLGLDEQNNLGPDAMLDYVKWRQTARCGGYLARMAAHEARTGQEVIPYPRP